MPTTAERTLAVIADHFCKPIGEIDPQAQLTSDLGADSLDVVELRIRLEQEFDINLDMIDGLLTVEDVVNHMKEKIDG